MSREDAETVRRALSADEALGLEKRAERYWHPEIEYVKDPRWPGASRYSGRDAVVGCFQAYMEFLAPRQEDWTVTVERVVDAGARQAALVRFKSQASASGVPHEHLWAYVAEVKDGRVSYLRAYYEPSEALEAVGLQE